MKIVYLHQYFNTPDMVGGTRSYEMAKRLVDKGHSVQMITSIQKPSDDDSLWQTTNESGIEVHWTPVPYNNSMSYNQRIKAFFAFAWRAARKVTTFSPDVIFATSTPLTISLPAIYGAKRARCPMVFEVRDLWPLVPIEIGALNNPITKQAALQLERFAYRHAKRIVALAPGMGDHVSDKGYPKEHVTIIPNGSDLELFDVDETARNEIRQAHAWLGDNPLVLYSGALGLINGVDYLAEIAAVCLERAPDIRFALIGLGKEEELIRQRAKDLGVMDKNLFFLGAMPKKDMPAWHAAADLTTALIQGPECLWKHAVQNKFFDSLAASRPIACNFRGWQSIIADQADAGIIIDYRNPSSAADHFIRVLHDRDWLKRAGANARKLGEERFDRNLLANQLEAVLKDAVVN